MLERINHISKQQLIFSQWTAWSMDRSHQCIVSLRWRNLYSATATVILLFSPLLPKQYLPSQTILFLACPPAVSSAVVWPTATPYPPQCKVLWFYSIFFIPLLYLLYLLCFFCWPFSSNFNDYDRLGIPRRLNIRNNKVAHRKASCCLFLFPRLEVERWSSG